MRSRAVLMSVRGERGIAELCREHEIFIALRGPR
jgi:hypothetical protein